MERLDLDDPRWRTLTSFFGDGTDIPRAVGKWMKKVGTPREWKTYEDGIREIVLHQMTITNGSLAFVPWLLHVYATRETNYRLAYMTDIAAIEANRLSYGLYYNEEGTEEYPAWLMGQYHQAVANAALAASDLVKMDPEAAWECGLLPLMPAFKGEGTLAWEQWRKRYGI